MVSCVTYQAAKVGFLSVETSLRMVIQLPAEDNMEAPGQLSLSIAPPVAPSHDVLSKPVRVPVSERNDSFSSNSACCSDSTAKRRVSATQRRVCTALTRRFLISLQVQSMSLLYLLSK